MISTKPPKEKACKVCRTKFAPQRPMATCCSPFCALSLAKSNRAKAEKVAQVKERREDKAKKAKLATIPQLMAEAQRVFNGFIRARAQAEGHLCISSGKPLDWSGNQVDAGHFRSRGAAGHLRFTENNVHCQTKYENRYRAGNVTGYRIGLIARIGLAEVEALESNNTPHKWTREELIAIKTTYTARTRALIKERE